MSTKFQMSEPKAMRAVPETLANDQKVITLIITDKDGNSMRIMTGAGVDEMEEFRIMLDSVSREVIRFVDEAKK